MDFHPRFMKKPTRRRATVFGSALFAAVAPSAAAGISTSLEPTPLPPPEEVKEETVFDKIWAVPAIYKNRENPVIQEFKFTGRYHGQYAWLDSDQGKFDDWENRRFRLGAEAILFHDFLLKGEFTSNDEFDPFYNGFTELFLSWRPDDAFNLTIGKQKPRFSLDWSTSSRELLTFERDVLINNFGIDYLPGISVSGKKGKFSYFAGVFNNETDKEFGSLEGGHSFVVNAAYDFGEQWGVDKASLRVDYIHSRQDEDNTLLTKFENGAAVSLSLRSGKWGLAVEALGGEGPSGEAWGFYALPSYDITKKLQAVARYTYGHSGDDILRAQSRYEREAPRVADGGNGGTYNSVYAGLNYYIHGHRLKLMSGVEYSRMDGGGDGGDYDGWTVFGGLRLFF